jgi:hypothetical protein
MIIASCSTLPSRVENANFKKTVQKLLENPRIQNVYIHYPKFCKRLEIPYPEIPIWMLQNEKMIVNPTEDYGPLTKVAPLFDLFPPKSDIGVLLFDDDRLYPEAWITQLLDAFERHGRNAVVGYQGTMHKALPFEFNKFNLKHSTDQPFSCLKTASGVIYPFKAFPLSVKNAIDFADKYKHKASLRNDDMLLASWCYQSFTPLYLIPVNKQQMNEWYLLNDDKFNDSVSLSNIPNHSKPQIELAKEMIRNGDYPIPWPEVAITVALIVIIILLIISSAVIVVKMKK